MGAVTTDAGTGSYDGRMDSTPLHRRTVTVLLAALGMIGPFSIDGIFPGFPGMARDFAASTLAMQQTVSVYLLAYAVMSMVHGPISDARGRRPVIVFGMLGYALASVGAALASSLDELLVWRALQGVCAGAGMVVGRAVVRDLFDGAEAQRLMSQVTMIFGLAPAFAPVVGAQLVLVGGWRGIFVFLVVFALLLVAATLAWLPESHPPERRQPLAPRVLLAGWRHITGDRGFWALAISGTLNFGALFLYIAAAPTVVMGLLGLSEQAFPWLFVPIIAGIVSGAWVSSRRAGRSSATSTVNFGYLMMLIGTLANLALALSFFSAPPAWVLLPLYFIGLGVGTAFPTLTILLLDRFPTRRGGASSMQAFLSLLFSAALAGAVGAPLSHHLWTMAVAAGVITCGGWLAWRWYATLIAHELERRATASAAEAMAKARPIEPG